MRQIFLFLVFLNASISSQTSEFIKGVDISFVPQIEDLGGAYYLNNVQTDPIEIFRQNEINFIRLRLWHTPANEYIGLESTLEMAARIKQSGAKFLLDFHYSDTWADPGHQTKPVAWNGLAFDDLKDSVYIYTKGVITALKNQNTLPDMVQIGNEVVDGMLWPDGKLYNLPNPDEQLIKFADLIKEGLRGVDDASDSVQIKTMIHIPILDGNINNVNYFYDRLNLQNVIFDIIGLSYYPWEHGTLSQLTQYLNGLASRYNKDIIVVETAYPWTLQWDDNVHNIIGDSSQLHIGYPASIQGQYNFLHDLIEIVKNVPNNKGAGVFYWAPEYISVPPFGSTWENLALFNFNGETLTSITAFQEPVSVDDENNASLDFKLYQNYPNPFNPGTKINYELLQHTNVELAVYNSLGEEINVLTNEIKNAGEHFIEWNGRDSKNNSLPSGIYFIKLITENKSASIKAILLK